MTRLNGIILWIATFTAGFMLAATPAVADTLQEIAQDAVESFAAGNYGMAAVLIIVALVTAARKYLPQRYPFWGGDLGGSVLVLGAAFATIFAAGLPTAGWSVGLFWASAKAAAAASGGYTLVKRFGGALIGYASARGWIPGWLNVALMYALKLFQPAGQAAIAKAEAAGTVAVEKNPPTGLSGPSGTL